MSRSQCFRGKLIHGNNEATQNEESEGGGKGDGVCHFLNDKEDLKRQHNIDSRKPWAFLTRRKGHGLEIVVTEK